MPLSPYELDDLHHAMMERMGAALLPALAKANRTGDLHDLLQLLGMADLLGDDGYTDLRSKKIIVLGDSMVKEGKLRSIAKRHGIDASDIEFVLGYDELKHFNFGKLRNSLTYRAVLAGPMPHSTPGKRGASSAIAEMQAHPEAYPSVVEMRDSSGLKITNNSFAKALDVLAEIV